MAINLYDHARVNFALGQINWVADNIKVAVLSPAYVAGLVATANDLDFSAIAPFILTGVEPIITLINKVTSVGSNVGALSANPIDFVALDINQIMGFYVVFKDPDPTNVNGAPALANYATSPLLVLYDTGFGLGAGTNGFDIQVTWHPTEGMFKL